MRTSIIVTAFLSSSIAVADDHVTDLPGLVNTAEGWISTEASHASAWIATASTHVTAWIATASADADAWLATESGFLGSIYSEGVTDAASALSLAQSYASGVIFTVTRDAQKELDSLSNVAATATGEAKSSAESGISSVNSVVSSVVASASGIVRQASQAAAAGPVTPSGPAATAGSSSDANSPSTTSSDSGSVATNVPVFGALMMGAALLI